MHCVSTFFIQNKLLAHDDMAAGLSSAALRKYFTFSPTAFSPQN